MATNSPTYNEDAQEKGHEEDDEELYKEFSAEHDLSPDERSKLVEKLDTMFRYAVDNPSWISGRNNMIKCFKYKEGEQWTVEEEKVLEDRHQPNTVNNQIAVVVNRLVGDLVNQRFRVGFRGRNAQPDEAISNTLSDIMRYIRQSNDMEFEERDMAEDGFTCGMGVLDLSVEFDDLDQPEIKVRAEDPLIVFPDPDSRRYDWNIDAKFVSRAKWWSLEEACETFPQAEKELKAMAGGGASFGDGESGAQLSGVDRFKGEIYIDKSRTRVRVIEVQYKKFEREQVLLLSNGKSVPFKEKKDVMPLLKQAKAAGVSYKVLDRLNHKICVGLYAAGTLLEHKETDHKYFSLVPYFAYRRKTGEPYSLITLALSMQDAINKRESKALHLLNTNQAVYEKGAVDDPNKLAEEKAKPDGNIELRDGALSQQRFMFKENTELANSQFSMHKSAQQDLFAIVGMDPRMGQQTGELRSGAGLQRKYAEASKPVAQLFDNIRRTSKIFAKVALDLVQKYYTGEKVLLVTDDQGAAQTVGISADRMEQIKTGIYDAVVSEFEDDDNVQDEQFRIFAETLPQLLQFPAEYTSMLVGMSRIRNKEEVLKVLNTPKGPPPVSPKMNLQANLDMLQPVERAGVWELVGRKDIADQVRAEAPPTSGEMKASVEMAKEKTKAGASFDPMETEMEIQQKTAEHQMKMQEMTTKHELEMQKHQAKIQMEAMKAATQAQRGQGEN